MNDVPKYLIRKGAYWYRPNCQGYTADPAQAGRYTYWQAVQYTHPNGLDGPRDGLSYVLESEVPCANPTASQHDKLVEALDLARNRLRSCAIAAIARGDKEASEWSQWAREADAALSACEQARSA